MFSDTELTAAESRLENGKLRADDISRLVASFRTILGGLESRYKLTLKEALSALDDTANDEKKAAQMAAVYLRVVANNFGVATLFGDGLRYSQEDKRRLFLIYALGIFSEVPTELAYPQFYARLLHKPKVSGRVALITVPPGEE